jgi:hypothetical protein
LALLSALWGLPVTFYQAWSARRAAAAAEQAVRQLEGKLNLANLGYAYSQLDNIRTLIASGNLAAAQLLLGPVKRTIIEACHLLSSTAELTDRVAIARKSLRVVEHQLNLAVGMSERYNASTLSRAIMGLSDFLVEMETVLKFTGRGG